MKHITLWLATAGAAFLLAASYHLDAAPVRAVVKPTATESCPHATGQSGFAWASDGNLICLARPDETVEMK